MFVYTNFLSTIKEFYSRQNNAYLLFEYQPNYFQDKFFGDSVKEVAYTIVYMQEEDLSGYGFGKSYSLKKKAIGSILKIDPANVNALSERDFFEMVVKLVIEETMMFEDFKIKKFDLSNYIGQLEHYFQIMRSMLFEGMSVHFPPLSQEIIDLNISKWSRL